MIPVLPRRARHGSYGLIVLAAGAVMYLLTRDPVPILGIHSLLDVRHTWWLGSLPSATHGAAMVFGVAWAIRGATRRQLMMLPASALGLIEFSQAVGPLRGWGTFDPTDLLFGVVAILAVAGWLRGPRSPSIGWSSTRTRLVVLVLIAAASAAASAQPGPLTEFDVILEEPTLIQVDADTTIIEVSAVVVSGPAIELIFGEGQLGTISLTGTGNPGLIGASVSMGSCGAFNTHGAGCRFTVIRTDPDVDSVSVVFGVRATDGDDIYAANASQVVLVTFGAPTTSGGVGTTSIEEGSVPPPICAEVAPQQRAYPLEVGRLVDEVLVQTYAASSHSRTGRAVVLAADGSGVLHVGLVIDRREHNPCTDGRIDDLTYRLEVSGREGDRGNLAVRPALFVNDDVFIAAPLSITNGAGVNNVLVLTPADFSPLQGSPILDLVSGPPVRFGLVAGVPCPQTSTCGAIERGLTVDLLEIVVNEGTSTP